MAKHKNASRRGNYRSGSKPKRQSLNKLVEPFHRFLPARVDYDGIYPNDDATNTSRGRAQNKYDKKLRNTKVTFVSAGFLERIEPGETAKPSEIKSMKATKETDSVKAKVVKKSTIHIKRLSRGLSSLEEDNLPDFIIDLQGSGPVETGLSSPRLGSISPASSHSSEEVILFKGRKKSKTDVDVTTAQCKNSTETFDVAEVKTIEDVMPEKNCCGEKFMCKSSDISDTAELPTPADNFWTDNKQLCKFLQPYQNVEAVKNRDHDDLITDYMENTDSLDVDALVSFSQRDLGGGSDYEVKCDKSSTTSFKEIELAGLTWDSSNIQDLSKRGFPSTRNQRNLNLDKSLIQQQNDSTSNLRSTSGFIPHDVSTLTCLKHSKNNNQPESNFSDRSENENSSSEENFSIYSQDIDDIRYEYFDLGNSTESEEDYTDSDGGIQTDFLLTKHEELAKSSPKALFHDKEIFLKDDRAKSFPKTVSGQIPHSRVKKQADKQKKKKKKKGIARTSKNTIDINNVTSNLNRLHVDDLSISRPKTSKVWNEYISSNSPDLKIEDFLKRLIQNDRSKKSERKKQREILRAHGQLGRKSKMLSIQSVHKGGMNIKSLKDKFEIFLKSNHAKLSLPPMPKDERKVVHEMANLIKLRSKSVGNGSQRFITLYRTARTPTSASHAFRYIESNHLLEGLSALSKKNKKNLIKNSTKTPSKKETMSYQDGDIVGASAPELAANNRGRAILEKMGWSSGTALGAHDNKGRLQPVAQVFRTTRAGLK